MKKTIVTEDRGRKTLDTIREDMTSGTTEETAVEEEAAVAETTTAVVTAGAIIEAIMIEIKETIDQSLHMINTEVPKPTTITHRQKTRRESFTLAISITIQLIRVSKRLLETSE